MATAVEASMHKRAKTGIDGSRRRLPQAAGVLPAAGIGTLVLSPCVPGTPPALDRVWYAAVKPHFRSRLIVGRELMVL